MFDETVHASKMKERLAFEVCVDKSAALSLIKQIAVKCAELDALSQKLVGVLSVEEESQSR